MKGSSQLKEEWDKLYNKHKEVVQLLAELVEEKKRKSAIPAIYLILYYLLTA